MKTWTYKVESTNEFLSEEDLNEFGRDGWEVVGVTSYYHLPTNAVVFVVVMKKAE